MIRQGLDPIVAILLAAILAPLAWAATAADIETGSESDATTVTGPLDGMAFKGMLGPDGKPKDIHDLFVFEHGNFVSKECELRCQYPARPYFVRQNGDKIEFVSETRCPYKDATITWRGTVDGNRISGRSTWVVKRWYWTYESDFEFEGQLSVEPTATASSE